MSSISKSYLSGVAGNGMQLGVEALAAVFKEMMLTSVDERRLMAKSGCAWIDHDFSWQGVEKKMKLTYEWMLGPPDCPDWVRVG